MLGKGDGVPRFVPALLADKVSGLVLGQAVIAALLARERFGHGQEIDVPMYETMVGFGLLEHLGGSTFLPPEGPAHYDRLVTPYRRPMRTRDGYMAFTPYSRAHWQRFFIAAGRSDLKDDPRVIDPKRRNREIGDLYALVAELLPEKTSAAWDGDRPARGNSCGPGPDLRRDHRFRHLAGAGRSCGASPPR